MAKKVEKLGRWAMESANAGERLPSIEEARTYFLNAVRNLEQRVLDDLSGEPYRLYRKTDLYFKPKDKRDKHSLVARHIWNTYMRPSWKDIETPLKNHSELWQCSPVDTDKHVLAFRECLIDWSVNSKLNEVWCRERAYETLDLWCFPPEDYKNRIWMVETLWPSSFRDERQFIFRYRTKYPLINSQKDELEIAVGEFRREYDAFLIKIKKRAKAKGLKSAPLKPLCKHFDWVVRYHLQEWNYADIAEHYKRNTPGCDNEENSDQGFDDNYIRHKVPEIARLIGLKLTRRGRPPKKYSCQKAYLKKYAV